MIRLLSFSFSGRSDRLEFWRVQVLTLILGGAAALASLVAIQFIGGMGGLLFLAFVPLFALTVAVCVRRLHDRGKRGWWYLIFVVVPIACSSAASELGGYSAPMNPLLSLLVSLPGAALSLWGLVEIGFLRGERGSNSYGDEPARGMNSRPSPRAAASG